LLASAAVTYTRFFEAKKRFGLSVLNCMVTSSASSVRRGAFH
jgi:hypothetical protein